MREETEIPRGEFPKHETRHLEAFGKEEQTPLFFQNLESWEQYCHEELAGVLDGVDQRELDEHIVMWRGMDPSEILGFLTGATGGISVHATEPNGTTDWKEALSYNRNPESGLNMAIGFLADGERMKVDRSHLLKLPSDLPQEAKQLQQRHFILNGDITPDMVCYVAVRMKGEREGKPGPICTYRVHGGFLEQLVRQREARAV